MERFLHGKKDWCTYAAATRYQIEKENWCLDKNSQVIWNFVYN